MTHFSDPLRTGRAFAGQYQGNNNNPFAFAGAGAQMSPLYCYVITPLTLQTNNYAASQTPGAGGNLTLTAGTGITSLANFSQANGATVLVADVPRNVRITSAANDSGRTFTVTGYDVYGSRMTEAITGPNTTTVQGIKAFKYILSIAADAATAGAITVGTGDKFGLPYAVPNAGMILPRWAQTLAQDAGTFVAAVNTLATSSTGDVRGTYLPSSASNGTNVLVAWLYVNDTNVPNGLAGTNSGLYGVVQA